MQAQRDTAAEEHCIVVVDDDDDAAVRSSLKFSLEVEGFAVYNFQGSDLCSPGSVKVKLQAKRQKK